MKKIFVLFSLIFLCASLCFGQKLGHSALSPFAGDSTSSNHSIYFNTGEAFDQRFDMSGYSLFDGLLHNISNDQFAEFYIHVKFFYDENQNGIKEPEERLLSNGAFTLNGIETYSNYDLQGIIIRAEDGEYQIEYSEIGTADWELTNQESHSINLNINNRSATIEFGLYRDPISELSLNIVSDPFRCFFPIDYRVCIMNYGSVLEKGTVWIEMDPRFTHIWYEQEPDHMIDSTFIGYDIEIEPGVLEIFKWGIRGPEIMDASQLGELYITKVRSETDFGEVEDELTQALTCSYDPNDKLINPNRPDSLALLGIPLTYTIRFQNTGNAPADNVVVRDTMSDDLNMNTFRLIDTSHPDELSVVFNPDDHHIVSFEFDNIFLPDSTENYEASNGFVMYQISVKEDTPINTIINNTAHIYFDFNPAIVTNTTGTTMVDTFPTIVAIEDFVPAEDFLMYPNPTNGLVYFDREVERVNIYDIHGRMLGEAYKVNHLDLRKLSAGTYMIELFAEESKVIKKLLITD